MDHGHKSVSFRLKGVPQFTCNSLVLGCLEKINADLSMAAADIDPDIPSRKMCLTWKMYSSLKIPAPAHCKLLLSLRRVRDESWAERASSLRH